ncbi:MAG TPA: glycoside hydrolase family 30 beta sandwich domain-containing protein [Solirubrobacteraceae bacterium]|nr:glycoside hydrolase family 30 beta sandwich domain-containing protein [Solirubrobacteraceae bacterium]
MHGTMFRLRLRGPRQRRFVLAIAVVLAAPLTLIATASRARAATRRGATVTIEGARSYQRIAGFGASEAFGQAATVMNASPAVQRQVLSLLYSPRRGAGLTILRNEISADPGTTIEPDAPRSPSAPPRYLPLSAIDQDQGQLWFARRIKADYGITDVFADAWSAPGFMKTNGSPINGGTLCGVPGATCASGDWRQAYANYLAQYAKDYAAAGDPLSYVGPENEANIGPAYDSMIMSPAQSANFMEVLGPTLWRSRLPTRAECCATEGWDYAQQYAAAIEADPLANLSTPLFTSHGYTAAPDSPLSGWSKPVWETEWSTFQPWDPAWDDGSTASGFSWAQNIDTGLTAANLNAFLYWWGSTTPTENGDNEGLIEINGNSVATSGRLWAFANYSRFVRPGAVRIGASSADGNLEPVAFRNLDGSVAIVVLNTATSAQSASFALRDARGRRVTPYLTDASHDVAAQPSIRVRGDSFTATLPPRSLVTYVIGPRRSRAARG